MKDLENQYADLALKLLLELGQVTSSDYRMLEEIRWDFFLKLARENRIAIRLYEKLLQLGVQPDEFYQEYANKEKERVGRTVELMGKISEICEDVGIDFIFMKNYQHYPDMGEDIDLFLRDYNNVTDSAIVEKLDAKPCKLSLHNRIGGKTQYFVKNYSTYLEIHHGRLGPLGEYSTFPHFLMQNRITVRLNDMHFPIPSTENQFIIQVLERVYGRFYLRISELVYSFSAIYKGCLDWDYITKITRKIGIFDGLCYYLNYLNAIHRDVTKRTLPLHEPKLLDLRVPIKVRFKGSYYRLSIVVVGGKLFLKKFFTDIRVLNWDGLGRLCLVPFLAMFLGIKALQHRYSLKKSVIHGFV